MSVIALDIGSSRIKALMADWDGHLIDRLSVATPRQSLEVGEQAYPADMVRARLEGLVGALAAEHPRDPVDTLVFSCLGTAMVPVDGDGVPLGAALAPSDTRPLAGLALEERIGLTAGELRHITGSDPAVASFLLHALWWCESRPLVMARLHRFRSLRGYAISRLCGADVEDSSWASRTMLFDLESGGWSEAILAAARLPAGVLPAIEAPTTTWPVDAVARARLGLADGAVAVLGGMDNCCSFLGASQPDEGGLVNIVGTYEHLAGTAGLSRVRDVAAATDAIVHAYVLPDQYIAMTRVPIGDLLAQATTGGQELESILDAIDPAPHGLGLRLDARAVRAELSAGIPPARVVRELLESAATVMKRFADAWDELVRAASSIVAVGGGSARDNLLQLKASLLARPVVTLAVDEAACLGALRLAAMATRGLSADSACELFRNPVARTVHPLQAALLPAPGPAG